MRHIILKISFFIGFGLCSLQPAMVLAALSPQAAGTIAQQYVPGRILAVKRQQQQGREVYMVKVLNTQGEVHVIILDATSGEKL